MPRSPQLGAVLALVCASPAARAQNFLPLDFSQNVQAVNALNPNNSTLGPAYYSGMSLDFVNVTTQNGQAVDARVTILGTAGNYNFVGWIPDYNSDAGQPEGDLGVYYRHDGMFDPPDPENPLAERFSTGGIAYTISFFEGGGLFTTSTVLSEVGFLIYDFDGEEHQSESIRTYQSDGFAGYRIYGGSGIQASEDNGIWNFDAAGNNLSETSPAGSIIAYYQNASTIRFDMYGTTSTNNPAANNGIFAGFDGDLSLTGGTTDGFGAFVPVPEPSTTTLIAAVVTVGMLRRGRSRG